jgi:MarR family transcriptional regulator for hemolysin
MPRGPRVPPIGLQLATTGRRVSHAFDAALAEVGGSRPSWLILLTIKTRSVANQQEIADAVGIRGATLTHHLNAMEKAGLLTRRRDDENRRIHVVELTDAGEAAFEAMRGAASRFDRRLRQGLSDQELDALQDVLSTISANVTGT